MKRYYIETDCCEDDIIFERDSGKWVLYEDVLPLISEISVKNKFIGGMLRRKCEFITDNYKIKQIPDSYEYRMVLDTDDPRNEVWEQVTDLDSEDHRHITTGDVRVDLECEHDWQPLPETVNWCDQFFCKKGCGAIKRVNHDGD